MANKEMIVNRENLLKMADYIKTIPQKKFGMTWYRQSMMDKSSPECGTVGCVIGHCTALVDAKELPRLEFMMSPYSNGIDFSKWSENYTGLYQHSSGWQWCFSAEWDKFDNTPTGASERIKYFLKHGLPQNYKKQINGTYPLVYKEPKNWIWRLRFAWNRNFNIHYK